MLSKAHIHLGKVLKKLCSELNVTLLEEVVNGDMRYDFYIPTATPIVIEMDGAQHQATKADGHFFKTGEALSKYLKNDFERKRSAKHGKVILFNFTTKDYPSVAELNELIAPYIGDGDNENDRFLVKLKKAEEYARSKREKNSKQKEASKSRFDARNRPKRKLPGIRGLEQSD